MERPEGERSAIRIDWPDRLVMIGCGAMGGAMLGRWLACGLPPGRISVVRPSGKPPREGIATVREASDLFRGLPGDHLADSSAAPLVVLALKPQHLAGALDSLQTVAQGATVVSLLAGVDTALLRAAFPGAGAIVRAMPNLPVAVGAGVVALYSDQPNALAVTAKVMQPLGLVEIVADEADFDGFTALAGCGPAFVARFVQAVEQGGVALGLSDETAQRLTLATLAGTVAQLADYADAQSLIAAVASKGGSTQAGLDRMGRDGEIDVLMAQVLRAAAARAGAMGAEARTALQGQAEGR